MTDRLKHLQPISFRAQLAALFLFMAFLLGGMILGFFKYQQDQLLHTSMQRQAEVVARLAVQDVARMVYLDDPDVASDIAERLRGIPEILEAGFFGPDGQQLLRLPPTYLPARRLDPDRRTHHSGWGAIGSGPPGLLQPALNVAQQKAQNLFFLMVGGSLVLGLLFGLFLDRSFIARLAELSQAIRHAASQEDYSQRLDVHRMDEIGTARAQFNKLLERVEQQTETLRYQALHDPLTGLYNRHRMLLELDKLLRRRPAQGYHAVCYLDLDRFKVVNDTCGHSAGDELLQQLSNELLGYVSRHPAYRLGRLGDDEFLVLARDKPAQDIARFLANIKRLVENLHFRYLEREFPIGISIGCILIKDEPTTAIEVIGAADGACYRAKRLQHGGAITLRLGDQQVQDHKQNMDWVSRIYTALENNSFRLHLQPIVAPRETAPYRHFEVLLRLQTDTGLIGPDHFIPVAERFGLSPRLDLWVIEAVVTQLYENPAFLDRLELLAVNLSGLTVTDPHNRHAIDTLLKAFPIPPEKLCFEITETAVISEMEQAVQFIDFFRRRGIRFALDDFGSGMASFGYLQHLEVDILKIDGSFIRPLRQDPILEEMTRAMVRIGHITGKRIVAEQVEDGETAALLQAMEVDYLQGYHFARPAPFEQFIGQKQAGSPSSSVG